MLGLAGERNGQQEWGVVGLLNWGDRHEHAGRFLPLTYYLMRKLTDLVRTDNASQPCS